MNHNIPQLATIRIECNGDTGTAVLFFPDPGLDYVYVFTAKHCLTGKQFDKTFIKDKIKLDQIFNPLTNSYNTCWLTESDIVVVSDNTEDLALMILPKKRILELTGNEFNCQVIDTDSLITGYNIRGFAAFNDQQADRPFPMTYVEDQKDNQNLFLLKSKDPLDTYYQQALDNIEGLSGSGAYASLHGELYLVGLVHTFEDGEFFTVAKILAYNKLIDSSRFRLINGVTPETDPLVLATFRQMDANREEVNNRTYDTIGDVNIQRDTTELEQLLKTSGMAVIHGKPGVGKSALAKSLIQKLKEQQDITVVTFTPEQLYFDTLPEALEKAGYSVDMRRIVTSPLSGSRVAIWIESFEKLVESGFEGAFKSLLSLVKSNPSLMLLVTIRDYTLQKFKINNRFELPSGDIFYALAEFNDQELHFVEASIPEIGTLLRNQKIQQLLKTPYYLDKVVRILPELLKVDELDEIGFKKLMWEHIVEAGNPERGKSFSAVCLKRAKEMSLYTTSTEKEQTLRDLVKDNILKQEASELSNRYSPSHDILEDWALVRDIKQRQQDAESPQQFIDSLDNSPAGNRAFRLWLDEYYKNEPESSAEFVHTVLMDTAVSDTWKDTLMIATLRSDHAGILFDVLKPLLLFENGKMLQHVMNLLQTSCKTLDHLHHDFDHLLPVGSGWNYFISFIRENIDTISAFNLDIAYLSLIESWIEQLPEFNPASLPPAAQDAAFLLADFIERYQDKISGFRYGSRDDSMLKKYMALLFKLTEAAPEIIRGMLDAARNIADAHLRWTDKNLLTSICHYAIHGVTSDQLCKYFPNEVMEIAAEEWKKKEKSRHPGGIMWKIQEEPNINDFGLDENLKRKYGHPSGFNSYFYWMFLYHSESALNFLIPFLNTAVESNYQIRAAQRVESDIITVTFSDGSVKQYYGCYEYWVMYRGMNSRNRLISSLLMALEKGLLDLTDRGKENYPEVRTHLKRMIKETNNVALLGIASSLIQFHPELVDETSVALLGTPMFFSWDGTRYSSERISLGNYLEDPLQKQERHLEDRRPHRQKYYLGLVGFVAHYMFFQQTFNDLLFKQVDAMWEQLEEGNDQWKKFLFDMDARKYNFVPVAHPGHEHIVQLTPGYDATVQKMIDSTATDLLFPRIGTVWASKVFKYEEVNDNNYETWQIGYEYLQRNKGSFQVMTSPGMMAAIGLRDFPDQLSDAEVDWSQETLLAYADKVLKEKDWMAMDFITDEKEAIQGLSLIFKTNPSETIALRTKKAIFSILISHNETDLKISLEAGMTWYLAKTEPVFLRDCWLGMLAYIEKTANKKRSYKSGFESAYDPDEFYPTVDSNNETDQDWLENLTTSVVQGTIKAPEYIDPQLQYETHRLMDDVLRIIPAATSDSQQHEFIELLLQRHFDFIGDQENRERSDFCENRNSFVFFYPRFLLAQPQNVAAKYFLALLDRTLVVDNKSQTDEFINFNYELIQEHIRAVNDNRSLVQSFWELWELLRNWMIAQSRIYLMPLFFMEIKWNASSEEWTVLNGKQLYYKDFITKYGFNRINSSIKFLSGISFHNFMPDSISWVALMLSSKKANEVLVPEAEQFVQKAFYNYGATIKANKVLLNNFIFILDFLIAKYSTKAYMLKEELIQYK